MLTKMVDNPSSSVISSHTSTSLSRHVLLTLMRSILKRRRMRIIRPASAAEPKIPPAVMAVICLA